MRTRIGIALNKMAVNISVRGTSFLISWVTYSGGVMDAGTGAVVGAVATPQTAGPYQGLVHLSEAKSVLRQYVEIEAGDIIVDFPPAVPIDGIANLRFTMLDENNNPIPDQVFEQKALGGRLAQMWDAVVAGNRSVRTVLLKKVT